MESKTLEINYKGLNLEVSLNIEEKSDEWIVCLHGLQSNKSVFKKLFQESIFQEYSKLAIDYIGFWESSKPEEFSYNLEDQKYICTHVINSLCINKLHIIGHSMGGMIGVMLLEDLGEKIRSLVNMEGNLTLRDCGKSIDVVDSSFEEFSNSTFDELKNSIKGSPREKWVWIIPDYAFYKSSKSIVDWSKSEELLKIFNESHHERLFMYGDSNSSKIEFLDDSIQLAEVPDSGHFMILDNYKETAEKIVSFVK